MNRLRTYVAAVAMAMTATACVAPMPKQVAYNKVAHDNIKTIHVLAPSPVKMQVWLMNSPAASFGLIGALVAAGNEKSRETDMRNVYAPAHFDPLNYFKQQLTSDMSARGYKLVWDNVHADHGQIQRGRYHFRKSYAPAKDADAILDVEMPYFGYVAAGVGKSSPYRPTVSLNVEMLSRDAKVTLFRDYYVYNNILNAQNVVAVQVDPAYNYPHFGDLKGAGLKSLDGLKEGIDKLARQVANEL